MDGQLLFSPLIERAMRIAAVSHRNHLRKASNLPYISHPASVALILLKAGFDEEAILAAALLHDVVEDTDGTLEELAVVFPAEVIEYVDALTEEKTDGEGKQHPWQERKREHLQKIRRASAKARAIVLADKLHNLGTMIYDLNAGEEIWSRFGASPEKILWYYREMISAADQEEPRLTGLASDCRKLLSQLEQAACEE